MKPKIIMFGAGGHGGVVLEAARLGHVHVSLIVDDHSNLPSLMGVRIVREREMKWDRRAGFLFIVAVGDNAARRRIFERWTGKGGRGIRVVHPAAFVSPTAGIGAGSVVCAGAVVGTKAVVGDNCIINTCASVDHDCRIGDHAHACPGVRLTGSVTVGEGSMVGAGAVVLPGIKIGRGCVIGAGAVVRRNLPSDVTACGVPAKIRGRGRLP